MKPDYKQFLINQNITLKDAMKKLNDTGRKSLYVVDEDMKLIGSLTDGDIRRSLLNKTSLESQIGNVMNKHPKYIYQEDIDKKEKVKSLMYNLNSSIPIVDTFHVIIDIIFWQDVFIPKPEKKYQNKKNKVFVLAGGKGTRLEPFTRILPKPLIPLGDQPILEKIMDKFKVFGFERFILSLNYKADMIKMYFNDKEINDKYTSIEYIQEDIPLGTIGSLLLAEEIIGETFFITNADVIIQEDLDKIFEYHKRQNNIVTVVGCVKDSTIPYGVLGVDQKGCLKEIQEKPSYQHIINTGIYVAEPRLINYLVKNNRKDMNDLLEDLLAAGEPVSIYPILEDQWFDVGQWAEYERTLKYFEKL